MIIYPWTTSLKTKVTKIGPDDSKKRFFFAITMGTKIFGIEWAPLNVPLRRRLQTAAALYLSYVSMFSWLHFTLLLLWLLHTQYYWLSLLYLTWYCYTWDVSSYGGGPRLACFRDNPIMRNLRDYFPITLVKTADLDPTKKFLFGCHPHGILGIGVNLNFGTDVTGFPDKFPGITPTVLSLRALHFAPILRDIVMFSGYGNVTKESIDYMFTKTPPGTAACIVVGGAKEGMISKPYTVSLVLKNRKGFVKMALKYGAHLVPCFTFGETELYRPLIDNGPGSRTRRFQLFLQKILAGATIPFITGRGIFNYSYGILPYRIPLTTVVGRAIPVEKDEHPSEGKINQLHQRYMDELNALFDEHKEQYGYADNTMEFVEI